MKFKLKDIDEILRNRLINVIKHVEAMNSLLIRGYRIHSSNIPRKRLNSQIFFINQNLLIRVPKPKKWRLRVHPILNVEIGMSDKRDSGRTIFIDLNRNIVKIRGFGDRKSIVLQLNKRYREYIVERINEGAKAKCCIILWTDKRYLYLAVVFGKRYAEIEPKSIIAVDINTILHGITVGFLENNNIVVRRLPENLGEIIDRLNRIYEHAIRIEKLYGFSKKMGYNEKKYSKLRRTLRKRFYSIVRDVANKIVHEIIRIARERNAKLIVDTPYYEGLEELSQKYNGVYSMYMKVFSKRVEKLLAEQAKWYGIPIEFRRLPSSICPVCETTLIQQNERMMLCNRCGFRADRDEVPIYWALKLLNTRFNHSI